MGEYKANAKRTKKAIADAFIELLKTKAFDKISVQRILDAADVNRSTFYKYYQDKYDLARQILHQLLNEFAQLIEVKQSSPASKPDRTYKLNEKNKDTLRALFAIKTNDLDIFAEIISGLSKIYLKQKNASGKKTVVESYYFAYLHYVPLYFQVLSDNPLGEEEFDYTISNSLIKAFSDYMRIDPKSLAKFIENNEKIDPNTYTAKYQAQ